MNFEFSEKSVDEVKVLIKNDGYCFFEKKFTKSEYVRFCSYYGKVLKHRDSNQDGITVVKDNSKNRDGFFGLSNKELFPHTDRSTEKIAPNLLFLYCKENSGKGGDSILIDSKEILLELISMFGEENAFVSQGNAIFRDFNSEYIGNIFNKDYNDGGYFLRFRNDKFGYFNSELKDLLYVFYELMEKYKIVFKLKKNQGYIINNGRFLHGRMGFSGFREMWRMLVFDNFLKYKGFSI